MDNQYTVGYIEYKKGYKYQLSKGLRTYIPLFGYEVLTEYISLDKKGCLSIRKGYAWDGASGPTIDTKSSMRASLIHDALYQLIRLGLIAHSCKIVADELLESVCIEDGVFQIRARLWREGVEHCGYVSTLPSHEPKILIAP